MQTTFLQLNTHLDQIVRGLQSPQFARVMPAIAQMAVSDVKQNFLKGHAPDGTPWRPLAHARVGRGGSSPKPLRDTGVLMASIQGRAEGPVIVVGTNVNYANLHQFGGVVRPRTGRFLAIPLTRQARYAGSPRRFPADLRPRIAKDGQSGIMFVPKKDGSVKKVHYALVTSVTVPARPFLGFSPDLIRRAGLLVSEAILKASGA